MLPSWTVQPSLVSSVPVMWNISPFCIEHMYDSLIVHFQALRSTQQACNPIYVSVGHKIGLETAVSLTHACCQYRIPEPIRQVRKKQMIKNYSHTRAHCGLSLGIPIKFQVTICAVFPVTEAKIHHFGLYKRQLICSEYISVAPGNFSCTKCLAILLLENLLSATHPEMNIPRNVFIAASVAQSRIYFLHGLRQCCSNCFMHCLG